MADSVASPLLDAVCRRLDCNVSAIWNLKNKHFKQLRLLLAEIQNLLRDDRQRSSFDQSSPLRVWLTNLRDLVYDVDILVDNCERSKKSKPVGFFRSFGRNVRIDQEVRRINERLSRHLDLYHKLPRGPDEESGFISEVGFALSDGHFSFGRELEFSNIVNTMLTNDEERILNVMPIVGMGGIGKTHVAWRIYSNEKVISRFQFMAWVNVGSNLDLRAIAEAIVGKCAENDIAEDLLDPSGVLGGKRFLIVFDDVWDDDCEKWEKVKSWLNVGDLGSCVLVTTRSSRVATLMGTVPAQHLARLSDEDSWALFKCFAFGHMEHENDELGEIGYEIVSKCKGLPLAVKTIGSFLFSKTRQEWLSISHNDLWKVPEFKSHVLPVLKLSYDHLPLYLKQCFAFCSVFPRDYWINRENLVQLWIAEGFIRSEVGSQGLEDIAYDYYFMELLEHSFFHDVVRDDFGKVITCRMHDFMHDLARLIAGFEYSIESIENSPIIPGHVQDCSVFGNFEELVIRKKEKLRTLLLLSGKLENLCTLFEEFSRLRVLDLSRSGIIELPVSIGASRHLRYLNLSHTYIRRIPESIRKLKQLQTLELSSCYNLEELPKAISLLQNLRHLGIESCCSLTRMPLGIGKLRFLKHLPAFILGKSSNSANLQELNSLALEGRLDIKNLENVKNAVDAQQARLQQKINIQSLELSWSCDAYERAKISAQVIEFLRPPPFLKSLNLKGYRGSMFPSWMNSGLPYLVNISLINCNCQELPPLGQLPNLQDLYLKGLAGVQIIGHEFYGNTMVRGFPSLQQLELYNMPNLFEWKSPMMEETDGLTRIEAPFPCLETLIVEGCSKLTVLPFVPNLKNLALCNSNAMLLHSLVNLPLLPSLLVDNFRELKHVPDQYGNTNSIIKLTARECDDLETLFEVVQSFSSLRHLTILNCNSLDSIPISLRMFNLLEKIDIVECPRLVHVPDIMHKLSQLEEMTIEACPILKLPPKSIKFLSCLPRLVIQRCPELEKQLQKETTDEDTLRD